MNPAALRRAGIIINLTDDGRLTYRAPRGLLTPEVKAQLTQHRDRLKAELERDARIIKETIERLRRGQRWLSENVQRHMDAGPGGDRLWLKGLDVWDSGTKTLFYLQNFGECIWWPEGTCPPDAQVCCVPCGLSGAWRAPP